MQAIIKNTRYTEAQNTLSALSAAFNAATAEESRLLAALAAPADKADPLQAGLRLLRGEPAQRTDLTGLNRELAQVRERLTATEAERSRHQQEADQVRAELARAREEMAQAHTQAMGEIQAAHAATEAVRAELVKVQAKAEAAEQAHQEQRKTMAAEAHRQAERLTAAQGERDQAKRDAAQAREEAAGLRGRLEALETVMAQGRPADPASGGRKKT